MRPEITLRPFFHSNTKAAKCFLLSSEIPFLIHGKVNPDKYFCGYKVYPMIYLVYLSAASYPYADEDLKEILLKSRQNNEARNITGLLLYHEGSIIQVLEGEKEQVQSIYQTISRDPRHKNILQMLSGELEERNFPDWSMAFKTISSSQFRELTGYTALSSTSFQASQTVGSAAERKIMTLLKSYVTVNVR